MPSPRSRNEERKAHREGEVLRGCGVWPFLGVDSPLEPPFEPFTELGITAWDLMIAGFDVPFQGHFSDRAKRLFLPAPMPRLDVYRERSDREGTLYVIDFRHYLDDEIESREGRTLALGTGLCQRAGRLRAVWDRGEP